MRPIPLILAASAVLAGLSLAGCYDRDDAKPKAAPEPQAAAVLAGVDLGSRSAPWARNPSGRWRSPATP